MFKVRTGNGDNHSTHRNLKDAIDQADMIRGTVDFEHIKIVAGDGDDRDTGYVDSVNGTTAVVRWDSLVVTTCDTEDIEALDDCMA